METANDGRLINHLARRFYPESNIGGFSHADIGVAFYSQLNAILKPTDVVLDFGAGRGEHILDNAISYRRELFNLRGKCKHVEGCDIDDAVKTNPFIDHATVVSPGLPLPFPDNTFDIILSRFVFEHVNAPSEISRELLRVTKPGGIIAALTPNKLGYISIAGRMVPNSLHVRALRYIQPNRKAMDVFPTAYQLNTKRALRRYFGSFGDVYIQYIAGEPAYHFGVTPIYRTARWLHKHLPDRLLPLMIVYIRKHDR